MDSVTGVSSIRRVGIPATEIPLDSPSIGTLSNSAEGDNSPTGRGIVVDGRVHPNKDSERIAVLVRVSSNQLIGLFSIISAVSD